MPVHPSSCAESAPAAAVSRVGMTKPHARARSVVGGFAKSTGHPRFAGVFRVSQGRSQGGSRVNTLTRARLRRIRRQVSRRRRGSADASQPQRARPPIAMEYGSMSDEHTPEPEADDSPGSVFGNLPGSRPGTRSPRRGAERDAKRAAGRSRSAARAPRRRPRPAPSAGRRQRRRTSGRRPRSAANDGRRPPSPRGARPRSPRPAAGSRTSPGPGWPRRRRRQPSGCGSRAARSRPCEVSRSEIDRGRGRPLGLARSDRFLRVFWERAYRENITGLAAMVAYNLALALFPFALLILFVFGQVIENDERPRQRAARPAEHLPRGRAGVGHERRRPDPRQLGDDRRRRRDRRDLDRRLVLGRDGHRVLPHLPRRVPRLGRAEALRAGDARRGHALPRRERDRPGRRGRARVGTPKPAVRPRDGRRRAHRARPARGADADVRDLRADLLRRPQGPRPVAGRLGRGAVRDRDDGDRQRRSSPSTSASRTSTRSAARSASSSSPWSGSTSSAWR